jgi:hypothetical protein
VKLSPIAIQLRQRGTVSLPVLQAPWAPTHIPSPKDAWRIPTYATVSYQSVVPYPLRNLRLWSIRVVFRNRLVTSVKELPAGTARRYAAPC